MFDWIYEYLINSWFFPIALLVVLIAIPTIYLKKSKKKK